MPTYPAGVRYIKIAKVDKDGIDQTNILQSLTEITIPFSTGNITYNVISITEKTTFFLYSVPYTNVEFADRAELEYDFSSSVAFSNSYFAKQTITFKDIPLQNVITDNLNFYSPSLEKYVLNTYPQKLSTINLSGSVMVDVINGSGFNKFAEVFLEVKRKDGSFPTTPSPSIKTFTIGPSVSSFTGSFHISMSYGTGSGVDVEGFSGDEIYPRLKLSPIGATTQQTASFTTDTFFRISSSVASGPNFNTTPEPNFGSNDFFRDIDCQPLFNNADTNRRHNLFMDIDYSAGITEPTNFELLINGTALRAEVQISNYTTRRHVIPRYEGSKSTSQKLNTWSKGDSGTYGKSPTVESLKRAVAYSDVTSGGIGGWPPERMNASTVFVRYLIDEDGDVKIPNTSENSLQDVQGTFQTGERVLISSGKPGSGEASAYRKIIRGGARIEPILYTQSGSAPNAQFNTTMSFEDIIPSVGGNVGNYIASAAPPFQNSVSNAYTLLTFNYITAGGTLISNTTSKYTVPAAVISDGVTLNPFFKRVFNATMMDGNGYMNIHFRIVKKRGSEFFYYNFDPIPVVGFLNASTGGNIFQGGISIPPQDLQAGDELYVEYLRDENNDESKGLSFPNGDGYFKVSQYPNPTQPVTSSGVNSIWNWGDPNNYPYIITSSQQTLVDLYNETAKQSNIEGSGFNTVSLPFSIEPGDEFRFEGREDFSYMVSKAFGPNDLGSRVFSTGSIEVHFADNLPTGSSTNTLNLDNFLIRRYVDDASQIIIEGFKPINSSNPYIISPEFSVPKLNKSIDEYITILTEKNLLS